MSFVRKLDGAGRSFSIFRGINVVLIISALNCFFPGSNLFCATKSARIKINVVLNNPPFAPKLVFPADKQSLPVQKVACKWVFSDPDPEQPQMFFQVEIDNDKTFKSIDYKSGDVQSSKGQWNCKSKIPQGTWYWRVRASDGYTWSKFSDTSEFRITKKESSKN